ncbi:MAG: DUF883 domain-containing protein [Steroidobacteraceae bacterium]|nr:DUF883 domain-containing protein [Steroidobacteraceae bacterium]
MTERSAERGAALAQELREVVSQAENLLHALGGDGNEALSQLRARVHGAVDAAKSRLADLELQATAAAQRASVEADVYARENPWTVVGAGMGVGLMLGALFTRSLRPR